MASSPVRKPGKLPAERRSLTYDLEYGTDTLEIHADALCQDHRVLVVDDLIATGGTMKATCDLVQSLGAEIVAVSVLIELGFLDGRERLAPARGAVGVELLRGARGGVGSSPGGRCGVGGLALRCSLLAE